MRIQRVRGTNGVLRTVRAVVLAVLITLSATAAPVVALDAGSANGDRRMAASSSSSTIDDWRLEISTRNDPYRTGANNTTRWVNGTVSLVDSEAVDLVYVTLNGNDNESFSVPVEKPGTVADGEFNFTITLDRRVNNITVTGYPNNDTVISDTLLLDGDVLPDTYEQETLSTSPSDPDSDSSETAANEADDGTIDAAQDFDGDALRAIDERRLDTDPLSVDTDDDDLRDGIEARYSGISPTELDGNGDGIPDRLGDIDGDGVDNLAEQNADTFLHLSDTDNDGIPDAEEIDGATDATAFDTDGDGISDGVEQATGTDPTNPDSDGDGVIDVNETLTTVTENQTLATTVEITGRGPVASVTTVRNATRDRFNTSVVRAARVGPIRRVEAGVNFTGATVTLGYDEAAIPNGNESDLVLYRKNETLNTFVPLNTSLDASADQLSATVHQDSTVVAMAQSVWRENFPEQPPEFSREISFEEYNESDCRPGCEVENGTVRYGNASQSSNSSSIDEDGPRIDDKDGGEETTVEKDVLGGFQEPESRSLPSSTGDPFRAELQKPEHDYAGEPIELTVVHNRNESAIESYEWYIFNDSEASWSGKVTSSWFHYNWYYNISVLVTTKSGETDWANLSKPATTHGKNPNIRIEGPTKAEIDNDTTYSAHKGYGSATEHHNWLVDGQDVENDACNSCSNSKYFEYDFQTEGYHTVTYIGKFKNGNSVTKKVRVKVEAVDPGIDGDKPIVDLSGPNTASVGESVSYSVDASDDGEIVDYNWSVRRPDGRWFNSVGDNASTYGGSVTRPGEYIVQVAVTDNQNQTTTDSETLTVGSDNPDFTDPPTVELRGPSFTVEGDNVSYYASAQDEDGIQSYDWRVQRPNGYWFDPANDDSASYGGVIDSGFYTIEVTVTDGSGESNTVTQTVLAYGIDTDLLTKHARTIDRISVNEGTHSTVVHARVKGEADEGYAKLVAAGESGTKDVFAVTATGAGTKDWRTVEVDLTEFAGEEVELRTEWTTGAEVEVDNIQISRDRDGDGLSNNREIEGVPNGYGLRFSTNPYATDTDGDGLSDSAEAGEAYEIYGNVRYPMDSYPFIYDSDGDHLSDKEEILAWGSEPKEISSDNDVYIDLVDRNPLKPDLTNELEVQSDDWNAYVDAYISDSSTNPKQQHFWGTGYENGRKYAAVRNASSEKISDGYTTDVYRVNVKYSNHGGRGDYPDRYWVNATDKQSRSVGILIKPTNESSNADLKKIAKSFGIAVANQFLDKITPASYAEVLGASTIKKVRTYEEDPHLSWWQDYAYNGLQIVAPLGIWGAKTYAEVTTIEADGSNELAYRKTIPPFPATERLKTYQKGNTPEGVGDVHLEKGWKADNRDYTRGFGWKAMKEEPGVTSYNDIENVLNNPLYSDNYGEISYAVGYNDSLRSKIALQIKGNRVVSATTLSESYNDDEFDYSHAHLTVDTEEKIISESNGIDSSNIGTLRDIIEDSNGIAGDGYVRTTSVGSESYIWLANVDGTLWAVRGQINRETGYITVRSASLRPDTTYSEYRSVIKDIGYTES